MPTTTHPAVRPFAPWRTTLVSATLSLACIVLVACGSPSAPPGDDALGPSTADATFSLEGRAFVSATYRGWPSSDTEGQPETVAFDALTDEPFDEADALAGWAADLALVRTGTLFGATVTSIAGAEADVRLEATEDGHYLRLDVTADLSGQVIGDGPDNSGPVYGAAVTMFLLALGVDIVDGELPYAVSAVLTTETTGPLPFAETRFRLRDAFDTGADVRGGFSVQHTGVLTTGSHLFDLEVVVPAEVEWNRDLEGYEPPATPAHAGTLTVTIRFGAPAQ